MRQFLIALAAFAVIALSGAQAKADEVFISGYTNGAFNGVPPNTSATQTATLGGLTYVNSTFSGTTAAGFRGIGGNPVAPPAQNFNNLGAFSLATTPFTYTGNTFTFRVTFTDPQGITGSNTATFTATVTGTVVSENIGGVRLDFDNTPILFTFNDVNCQATTIPGQQTTCGSGSFFFSVNDLSIDPGQTAAITGQITSAQQTTIPEPMTMILLGTGLAGVAARVRRRRASRRAD
jgi:PEP-CTERM motif-containing protein